MTIKSFIVRPLEKLSIDEHNSLVQFTSYEENEAL